MNKQTKIIVIVVLVIVVGGGLVYGINRWRQQRLANKILKEVYGLNTGLLGKITGGGISNEVAQELAKQAAKEEAEQKKEEAKTPEDRYNETEEMATYDANSTALATEAKNIMEKVFGKAKLTSISTNIYGGDMSGSGVMEFEIARLTTGTDLGEFNKTLTDKGLPILQSGIDNKTASIMAGSNSALYTIGFEIGGQTVGISIMKSSQ